ncbi:SGNH/GDSL hydrolase family protein [Cryobacterium sp. 10S3]|uniref:SGNH/GDSL hydrolase family protein n=1 Tax=Cryobacterium sp. 10S3 TaxID=3048582 RepID=UPI002AC9B7AA|nr:SGNH/GDSL hydrolase family protein [Cryobacterium sp. 10S3]MEB0285500.1 SGNH/GDSL hydrolase family protein [Cryobacterium sp. 10S3]WPX15523.1 SGNH/GDSL hydrolase family protein [Cryobacterium sp. 10S3]
MTRTVMALWVGSVAVVVGLVAVIGSVGRAVPAEPIPVTPAGSPGTGPVVAFYGDSYTLGTGASSPEHRWSTLLSIEHGWTEVNPSVNGLGFVNHRADVSEDLVDQVIAARPDIVIVTMGLNDNFSMPARADRIRSAITADFTRISEALPVARVIVVEPFWYTDDRPGSVQQIIEWVSAGAAAIDADYIPGASHWLDGHPEWKARDGLHPNDEGYRVLADRMDEALRSLGI